MLTAVFGMKLNIGLIKILSKITFIDYENPTSVKELKEQFFQKLVILEPNTEFDKVEECQRKEKPL